MKSSDVSLKAGNWWKTLFHLHCSSMFRVSDKLSDGGKNSLEEHFWSQQLERLSLGVESWFVLHVSYTLSSADQHLYSWSTSLKKEVQDLTFLLKTASTWPRSRLLHAGPTFSVISEQTCRKMCDSSPSLCDFRIDLSLKQKNQELLRASEGKRDFLFTNSLFLVNKAGS